MVRHAVPARRGRRAPLRASAGIILAVVGLVTAASVGPARPILMHELPATADAHQAHEGFNSPSIVADPSDSRFVAMAVRLDGADFSCGLELSGDGGRGWITAHPIPKLPTGVEKCYSPEVAFDKQGTLYYLFAGLHTLGNTPMGAFLTKSRDHGRTFSPPRRVLGPRNYQIRMAIDPSFGSRGRIHLVWLKALVPPGTGALPDMPNPILASHSDDGGRTFSKPVRVSDARRRRVVAPAAALGPGHQMNVAYYDLKDDAIDYQGLEGPVWEGNWELVVARSNDGGGSFSETGRVAAISPPGRVILIFTMAPPTLAADRSGRVLAAWPDARLGDPDVFFSRSDKQGSKWSRPLRLNDDSKSNGKTQDLPKLSVAPNSRVDAVFYDRRRDPENLRNDVYYTSSWDGGRTFGGNIRLTSESFSSRIGRTYSHPAAKGLVEFGSRLALVSNSSSAVAAWTDTRNATHPLDQHIFAEKFVVKGKNRAWLPAGLLAAGVLLLVSALRTSVQGRSQSDARGGPTPEPAVR